ncbi:hypothetical protein GCM10023156_53550 [Novipirellula rosea]|uniref:Uncharacterized protein n=1 Tax=Novipirellula rosea TaxID=1031540 RepID=A0ABP8NGX6_9BACT
MQFRIRFIATLTLLQSLSLTPVWHLRAAADDHVHESSQKTSITRQPSFVYFGTREIQIEKHALPDASNEQNEAAFSKLNPIVYYGTRKLGFRKPEMNACKPNLQSIDFDGERPFFYYGTRSIKTPTK